MAPPELETPFAKAIVVPVPNDCALPFLSVTVGAVAGELDEPAPPKVNTWSPVYEVATFPYGSRAVIVRLSAAPAVGVVVAAPSSSDETPVGATTTPPLVPEIEPETVSVAVAVFVPAVFSVTPFVNVWTPLSPGVNV